MRQRCPRRVAFARERNQRSRVAQRRAVIDAAELDGRPLRIVNTGETPVQAVVSVTGSPITPEPAAANGFKIERNYFTLDGKPADPTKASAAANCDFAIGVARLFNLVSAR